MSFEAGFIDRAMERGFTEKQAAELLKEASSLQAILSAIRSSKMLKPITRNLGFIRRGMDSIGRPSRSSTGLAINAEALARSQAPYRAGYPYVNISHRWPYAPVARKDTAFLGRN